MKVRIGGGPYVSRRGRSATDEDEMVDGWVGRGGFGAAAMGRLAVNLPRHQVRVMEGHGRPWKAMEGHGRPWKAMEGHGRPRKAMVGGVR